MDYSGYLPKPEKEEETPPTPVGVAIPPTTAGETAAPKSPYFNSIPEISGVLYDAAYPTGPESGGLIVVTGATNTSKSTITRGLIHYYLQALISSHGRKRRPHLVTFEDPIEVRFHADPTAAQRKIDYTPRLLGKDVASLEEGIRDALRQTPAVFYVGEVRQVRELGLLAEFAATGHTVVTTAHAATLQEAISRILRASNASTPARRSAVASSLRAVVHLTGWQEAGLQIVLPAIWRRTPRGLMALVADGLTSVVPYNPARRPDRPQSVPPGDNALLFSSLGREYFAERLAAKSKAEDKVKREVVQKAAQFDLGGR